MTIERFAWLFLNQIPTLSPLRFQRLLQAAGSAESILAMSVQQLALAEVEEALASHWRACFRDPQLRKQAEKEWEREQKGTQRIVTELDSDYPAALRELVGRPPVLYVQGRWPLTEGLVIGIVGTRHPTPYGETVAERITADLVDQGVGTVSGLAAGIDTVVHRTTLNKEGRTVASLGHGLGHRYPRSNEALFKQMAETGTLMTEFPFETAPEAFHFPRRNRIISGLSKAVLVVEAGARSGALITARYAAEQNRDVFAVPGRALEESHVGCHRLIRQGAKLVESADDILEEYGARPKPIVASDKPAKRPDKNNHFTSMEQQILNYLAPGAMAVDSLSEAMACSIDQLSNTLLLLELKGCIRRLPGQHYEINHQ